MLAWALEAFAGYVAVDARYEGPDGGLSAVAKRQDKRLFYAGLDHDPRHDDLRPLVPRLRRALSERELPLGGITTDGSALAPEPLPDVFGEGPPQIGTFQVRKERRTGVVRAVAAERRRRAASTPQVPRGRAASKEKAARRLARHSNGIQGTIRAWFQERLVVVKRRRQARAWTRCLSLTRGLPQRRQRRARMDPMDALCDRRCRTQTALGKRRTLRQWVKRFKWMGATFAQGVAAPPGKSADGSR